MNTKMDVLKSLERKITVENDLKLVVLRNGLYHYFKTFKIVEDEWLHGSGPHFIDGASPSDKELFTCFPKILSSKYLESFTQTIVSFHHFFELYIKDVLTSVAPELALNYSNLDRDANVIDFINDGELKSLEFKASFERLRALFSKRLGLRPELQIDEKYRFLLQDAHALGLNKLAEYRNRITHKGKFVLNYGALDYFMAKFIFPILDEALKCGESSWRSYLLPKPHCGLDLIKEISTIGKGMVVPNLGIKEVPEKTIPVTALGKLAYLKSIGIAMMDLLGQTPYPTLEQELTSVNLDSLVVFSKPPEEQDKIRALKNMKTRSVVFDSQTTSPKARHICPACGMNSIFMDGYECEGPNKNILIQLESGSCHYCQFSFHSRMGEPRKIRLISSGDVFVSVE